MLKAKLIEQGDERREDPQWSVLSPVALRAATPDDVAAPSPARALQGALDAALEVETQWSPRRRLACMVGGAVLCWATLAFIVQAVL